MKGSAVLRKVLASWNVSSQCLVFHTSWKYWSDPNEVVPSIVAQVFKKINFFQKLICKNDRIVVTTCDKIQ